jgi:hypothetical protein
VISTVLGIALVGGGIPVVVANLLSPSPIFGDRRAMAFCRILIGLGVSSSGLYFLA